jgi:hypothetical protein
MRLTDQVIFDRISKAMTVPTQTGAPQGASPQTLESLMQKAKAKRGGATPDIKMSPEQKVDLKARGM